MPLLEVKNVCVCYRSRGGPEPRRKVVAVDGVSFDLDRDERLGLVGESGSGKSSLARAILGLERIESGCVRIGGLDPAGERTARRQIPRLAQLVFQDPLGSLNPRLRVGEAIAEVLRVHRIVPSERCGARVAELLALVGLDAGSGRRYPHEFSGGQRQRIGMARALAVQPALLIADEPVSALDVSIQAQILNLVLELQRQLHFACLFIAHDLAVVSLICPRVMIMRAGRVVEEGLTEQVFSRPAHPYTRALLAAVPDIERALNPHLDGTTS
jgi:peptide/nickel transport system ATP-binding protein